MRTLRLPAITRFLPGLIVIVSGLVGAALAAGPQERLVYSFTGNPNGYSPTSTLIADKAGNLYGTTDVGGNGSCVWAGGSQPGCGAIFQLSPPSVSGGAWTETLLYSFQGSSDGALPYGGLVMDASGNLFGAASAGGSGLSNSAGTIYELSPPSVGGGAWTFAKLYTFQSNSLNDGQTPLGALTFDRAGNLYGTTQSGGTSNDGTVFELSPSSGGSWTETILHSFSGADGWAPESSLYADAGGNLYGTTVQGGSMKACGGSGCGVIFKLSSGSGGTWTEIVLHRFNATDGAYPYGGVTLADGNYYGTTSTSSVFGGTVFELTPGHGGPAIFTTIHSFPGPDDGKSPYSGIAVDKSGHLYGTTNAGGSASYGTVYKLSPPSVLGRAWTETVLANFSSGQSFGPIAGVLLNGNRLFGANSDCSAPYYAGCGGYGTVFAISNF